MHTVAAGRIDDLTFAFKGIIGGQQRAHCLHHPLWLQGQATRGSATGGKILGYVKEVLGVDAEGWPTDRLIVDEGEAALVRRTFELYANGYRGDLQDPDLGRRPLPTGGRTGKYRSGIWNPTTLSDNPALGKDILNNEIYIGGRIFNRRKWVEVRNENRGFTRVPRLNPGSSVTNPTCGSST